MIAVLIILLLFIIFLNINQQKKLYIIGNNKKYTFNVDVVYKNEDIMKGLMGVKHISSLYGMYFKFATPQPASFWMKNTLISLDILFIDVNGKIIAIEHGIPMSEKPILSPGNVIGVLEIKGGDAANLGIMPGYYVTF